MLQSNESVVVWWSFQAHGVAIRPCGHVRCHAAHRLEEVVRHDVLSSCEQPNAFCWDSTNLVVVSAATSDGRWDKTKTVWWWCALFRK